MAAVVVVKEANLTLLLAGGGPLLLVTQVCILEFDCFLSSIPVKVSDESEVGISIS